jgi:hypothetical protein
MNAGRRSGKRRTQIDEEADPALLFAKYELDVVPPTSSAPALDVPVGAVVFLNEEKAKVLSGREDKPVDSIWYLDTGASNHMTGDRASFTELDEAITRNMRFVDSLVVQIMGCGTIDRLQYRWRALDTNVFFIPRLKSSVLTPKPGPARQASTTSTSGVAC